MRPRHKFIDFVEHNKSKLAVGLLCQHPEFDFETLDEDDIDWTFLCKNPNPFAVDLLNRHPENIAWAILATNPSHGALKILKNNPKRIRWGALCANQSAEAMEMLEQNAGRIWGANLSANPHPKAVALLQLYPTKVVWYDLHCNSSDWATDVILEAYLNDGMDMEGVDGALLCMNSNPKAIAYWEDHLDDIRWWALSRNAGAMRLLKANDNKINWHGMSENPAIFQYDYARMTAEMAPIREELLRNRMHPRHLLKARDDWLLL